MLPRSLEAPKDRSVLNLGNFSALQVNVTSVNTSLVIHLELDQNIPLILYLGYGYPPNETDHDLMAHVPFDRNMRGKIHSHMNKLLCLVSRAFPNNIVSQISRWIWNNMSSGYSGTISVMNIWYVREDWATEDLCDKWAAILCEQYTWSEVQITWIIALHIS